MKYIVKPTKAMVQGLCYGCSSHCLSDCQEVCIVFCSSLEE